MHGRGWREGRDMGEIIIILKSKNYYKKENGMANIIVSENIKHGQPNGR